MLTVVPMEITFMDMKDAHSKYGTLRSLRYIYSNSFRFLISSLGLHIFFPRIVDKERWQNIPPTTTHRPDRIVTKNKVLHYHTATYSTSVYQFLSTFQPPIRSSTGASDTYRPCLGSLTAACHLPASVELPDDRTCCVPPSPDVHPCCCFYVVDDFKLVFC